MAIAPFLAMTAAEMRNCTIFPRKIAWMACHFSSWNKELSNLPDTLPTGALLVVDDWEPLCHHDPEQILCQLAQWEDALQPGGILLDFQRPGSREVSELVKILAEGIRCPLIVSEAYATDTGAAVFLPPVPLSQTLEQYLKPWQGREIWLDLGCVGEVLYLNERGCRAEVVSGSFFPEAGISEKSLHCHYRIGTEADCAAFTLWRTAEDYRELLEEAETRQVAGVVGLYQEWRESGPLQSFFASEVFFT